MSRQLGAGDRGSASVWILAAGLVIVTFATTIVLAGAAMIARHEAQTAADLGALAGAVDVTLDPSRACAAAAIVVHANGATLLRCRTDGPDIVVTASVGIAFAPSGFGPAIAVARAGPRRGAAAGAPGIVQAMLATATTGRGDATAANAASTASNTRTAPAFESGSLPLPHFGECTHDGQPRSQTHEAMASRVAPNHSEAT